MSRRLRQLALALTATIGTLAVGLAGVEAWFRHRAPPLPAWQPEDFGVDDNGCLEPHLTLAYTQRPGVCRTDADGLVTTTHGTGEPPLDLYVAGDSVAYSGGTWLSVAAEGVAGDLGRTVRLRNAGLPGYNLCQSTERLRIHLEEGGARPGLVLFQACVNDFETTPVLARSTDGALLVFDGAIERRYPAVLLKSHAARWLLFRRLAHTRHRDPEGGVASASGHHQARGCVFAAAELLQRHEVPAVFFVAPALVDPGDHQYRYSIDAEQQLAALGHAAGFPVLTVRETLAAAGSLAELRSHPDDLLHPGNDLAGQRLGPPIGEALTDALEGQGRP